MSGLVVRPLERVAEAAHRFGDGNLTARTDIDARASPEVREVAGAFDFVVEVAPGEPVAPWQQAGATWVLCGFGSEPREAEVRATIERGPS